MSQIVGSISDASETITGTLSSLGLRGFSAYELAVKNGFSGTEEEWLEYLEARIDVKTENNIVYYKNKSDTEWSIFLDISNIIEGINNKVDKKTGYSLVSDVEIDRLSSINNYDDSDVRELIGNLANRLNVLSDSDDSTLDQMSEIVSYIKNNKSLIEGITDAKVNVSDIIDDLVSDDINKPLSAKQGKILNTLINKIIIPTKMSQLEQDVDIGKIDEIKVNGETQEINNKSVDIIIPKGTGVMARNFVTNVSIGYLDSGSSIKESDTVADILYKILYKAPSTITLVNLYFGASNDVPVTIDGLDHLESAMELNPDSLLENGYAHTIFTGDISTGKGQYPVMASTKAVKLIKVVKWTAQGLDSIQINFVTIEKDNYYLYYIPTKTYDEDLGGTTYNFTFEEVI